VSPPKYVKVDSEARRRTRHFGQFDEKDNLKRFGHAQQGYPRKTDSDHRCLALHSVANLLLHDLVVGQKAFQSTYGEVLG
jgi:hypothetical protein